MKQALLTGINGRVGSLLASTLGKRGWSIHGICRVLDARTENLSRIASEEDWPLELQSCDLADSDSFKQHISWLTKLAPDLDAFVHLAAPRLTLQPIWRESLASLDLHWEVGAKSAFQICSTLLRPMSQKGNSHIIFVLSSVTLEEVTKGLASYTVGKYALLGLAHAISAEYNPKITVTCISPSIMDTPMLDDLPEAARQMMVKASKKGEFMPVEKVVQHIVNCLETSTLRTTPFINIAIQ